MARKFIWIFRIILQKNLEELFVQLKTDINLTKCAQDHYGENYNILGEITKANKWRDVTHSWTERLDSIKMSVLPNLVYRPRQSQSKSQQVISCIPKPYMKVYIERQNNQ